VGGTSSTRVAEQLALARSALASSPEVDALPGA